MKPVATVQLPVGKFQIIVSDYTDNEELGKWVRRFARALALADPELEPFAAELLKDVEDFRAADNKRKQEAKAKREQLQQQGLSQQPKSTQGATEGGSPPPTGRPPGNQRGTSSRRPMRNRGPTTKEEFRQFVYEQDLNISLAEDWYAMHEARDWTDNEGGPLKNWKGALTNYCRSRENQ